MITDRPTYSLAASATLPNLFTGRAIEWIGKASIMDLYGAAFLTSATDTITLTYTVGGDSRVLIPAGSSLNINAAGPQQAFDGLLTDHPLPMGSHLILSVTADATAGTHSGRFMAIVKP